MNAQTAKTNRISFQGEPGANSDTACRNMFPAMEPLPCPTFEDAFNALETGKADLAMIPIENTLAGRVADRVPTCDAQRRTTRLKLKNCPQI